jgi:predicted ATPase
MQRLTVKNFGPLKDIDIELKSINIIIGENGSGKSILGKLITILKNDFETAESIIKKFIEYDLYNYLKSNTQIIFWGYDRKISYEIYKDKIIIPTDKESLAKELKQIKSQIDNVKKHGNIKNQTLDSFDNLKYELTPQYIPAERNLVSQFSDYIATLFASDLPLPKPLIKFMSEFEKARGELKELKFLAYKYKFENGLNKVFYGVNEEDFLLLGKSSSGLQAIFPLLLVIEYLYKKNTLSFIVEEPELNLFPSTQYELIKFIIPRVDREISMDNINKDKMPKMLSILTHSPYILSSFNNLLFAHKVGSINPKSRKIVNELIEEKYWIDSKFFTANFLRNGKNENIFSQRGLISENEIDGVSEDIAGEFNELLDVYREFKDEK